MPREDCKMMHAIRAYIEEMLPKLMKEGMALQLAYMQVEVVTRLLEHAERLLSGKTRLHVDWGLLHQTLHELKEEARRPQIDSLMQRN